MYREISQDLIHDLYGLLQRHEYVAVWGPRQGGKSLLLDELRSYVSRQAPNDYCPRVISFSWSEVHRFSEKEFVRIFRKKLGLTKDMTITSDGGRLSGDLLDAVRSALEKDLLPIWFFIEDVSGLPVPMAREYSLPYQHAHKIVVTKISKNVAAKFFCNRRMWQRGKTHPSDGVDNGIIKAEYDIAREINSDAFDVLYNQTDGQPRLIQEIVVTTARHPYMLKITDGTHPWTHEHVEQCIKHFIENHMHNDYFSRMLLREIQRNADSFDLLLKIFRSEDGLIKYS